MSLNNIQLHTQLLTSLYPNVLVEAYSSSKTPVVETPAEALKYLGNNKKGILVLVENETVAYLEDAELSFLSNILAACKLSIADVAIINLQNVKERSYEGFLQQLNSKSVLLFGVDPESIDLPFKFPHFQLQQFGQCTYLSATTLRNIENDKTLKSKLWNCLKNLFGI